MPAAPAPRWEVRVPDLTGRRAIVTGGSDGVGFEIARGLAAAGADVVLPVRNRAKAIGAVARIREDVPDAALELADLDLAELSSVAACARALVADGRPVDILVLNAGMVAVGDRRRRTSVDGFELHFQTNHLGHFAFVAGIMPLLRAGRARVTVQSSLMVRFTGVRWHDLQLERRYSTFAAYDSSKTALSLFGLELGRRSAERGWGLTANLSHPGVALTNIAPAEIVQSPRLWGRIGRRILGDAIGGTPAEASLPALFASASEQARPGVLYGPGGAFHLHGAPREQRMYRRLRSRVDAERIWSISEQLSGVVFDPPPASRA